MTQEDPVWNNRDEVLEILRNDIVREKKLQQRKEILKGALIALGVVGLSFGIAWVLGL